jgi:hypothetical protein
MVSEQQHGIATKEYVGVKMAEFGVRMDWLEAKINQAKNQIIFWMFLFWVTELGAIFAFIKFLK